MNWTIDEKTQKAVVKYPLAKLGGQRCQQFQGKNFNPNNWSHRLIGPAQWPSKSLKSSPDEIIKQFRDKQFLQALALVVSWGGMNRVSRYIYDTRHLGVIEEALRKCTASIKATKSIENAWRILTGTNRDELVWSSVISSKTLHFLCRAMGFEEDPPVAIDNAVILNCVWPKFRDAIPKDELPGGWRGNSFDAYSRYMSAILTWARMTGWRTWEVEATIFARYGRNRQ